MNLQFDDLIKKEKQYLTKKKPHTKYKIEYVSKYVEKWCYISSVSNAQTINFIDCMCNAGIYTDGGFCSATKVLITFCSIPRNHPEKTFNIFLNDYKQDKIRIIKDVFKKVCPSMPLNLHVYYEVMDVNNYLIYLLKNQNTFSFPSRTILYVDPYSFHTVIIETLQRFMKRIYCELLFNLFTSDYSRNKNDKGIIRVLGGVYDINSTSELIGFIKGKLKVGNIRYFFNYPFRHSKNVELYQILFATPQLAGLDALKTILWDVFGGTKFYQTDTNKENGQLSLFSQKEDKTMNATFYSPDAMDLLISTFKGKNVEYKNIESFMIENTLFTSTNIIEYVIKPLIKTNKIQKQNLYGKTNYKKDTYYFC